MVPYYPRLFRWVVTILVLINLQRLLANPHPFINTIIFDVDKVILHRNAQKKLFIPPKITQLIKQLKHEKYRLFILSNMFPTTHAYLTKHTKLFSHFEGIHCGFQTGIKKPDSKSFTHLLSTFDLHPQQSIFIDDLVENVQAARKLGILSIHFVSPEQCCAELEKLGILEAPKQSAPATTSSHIGASVS